MPKRTFALSAAAVGLTASQVASAADLGWRAPPPAPVYVQPAPIPFIWTGCYVGGNIGGALTNIEFSNVATGDTVSASNSGVAGGGQIGCDYQVGAWVVGVRDMVDATSLSKTATFSTTPFTGTADSRTNWFDTLTARGGYLVAPNVLLYVQGGAAWTNANATFFNTRADFGWVESGFRGGLGWLKLAALIRILEGGSMPKPCSLELRERVVDAVESGASRRAAADWFDVSPSSAIKWMQRRQATGSIAAKPSGGSIWPLEAHADFLLR
jgi:hypothetical protein